MGPIIVVGQCLRTPRTPLLGILAAALIAAAPAAAQDDPDSALPEGISALPELLDLIDADYPATALEDDVQADVLVQISIDVEGRISEAVPTGIVLYRFDDFGELIEETLPPDDDVYGFVAAALTALEQFRFSPALDDQGAPVAVALVWRYGFYFEEEPAEPIEPGEPIEPVGPAIETGYLSGRLLERGTRVPIPGIEIVVTHGDEIDSAVTDVAGSFEFAGLSTGTWAVEISAVGFQSVRQNEDVVVGERTDVSYYLERESYGEYTYEVREEAVRREVSRQTLTLTEINRVPGNNGDAIKVIQNLPGFARSPFNGGLVVIRGSAPEDSRIFVEGVWIPVIFHFGGLTAVINSDVLEEIEYLPGAFSVEYGRATGGVINVETRPPRTDGYHGYVDVDIFDAGVLIEGPIVDGWSFFASGRRSYIDAILPAIFPDDAGLSLTVAPRYWDYQMKVQADPNTRHSVNLLLFGSDDAVTFLIEDPPADPAVRGSVDTSTLFHRMRLEWVADVSDEVSNRALVAVGLQTLDFTVSDDLFFILDSIPMTFRDTVEWRPQDALTLRAGLDIEYNLFDIAVRAPRPTKEGEVPVGVGPAEIVEINLDNQVIFEPALFVETEWAATDRLTLIPGLRLEYYGTVESWAVDGRLTARYQLTDPLTLKAAVGTFHQAPLPDETAEDFGNPDLGLEWALHYVAGMEYDFTDFLNLDLQLFYKDLNRLVARSEDIVERDGESVLEIYDNEGDGRVYGAEVLLRHELANNFFGWVSYTLSRSERRDGPDEDYRLFSWDQSHILAVVASYELPNNWAIGARFRYVTGNPDTPIEGSVFDADSDVYVRVPGAPRSTRVADFHQLDLRVDKRFVFDNWMLELYLDITNVYNRANEEAINYNFDYSESAIITGLPIIPSFGMRGSF